MHFLMGSASSFPSRLTNDERAVLRFGGSVTTAFRINVLGEEQTSTTGLAIAVDIIESSYRKYVDSIETLRQLIGKMGLWERAGHHRVRRCAILRFKRANSYKHNGTARLLLLFCRPALVEFSGQEMELASQFLRIVAETTRDTNLAPVNAVTDADERDVNQIMRALKSAYTGKEYTEKMNDPALDALARDIVSDGLNHRKNGSPRPSPILTGEDRKQLPPNLIEAIELEQKTPQIQALRIAGVARFPEGTGAAAGAAAAPAAAGAAAGARDGERNGPVSKVTRAFRHMKLSGKSLAPARRDNPASGMADQVVVTTVTVKEGHVKGKVQTKLQNALGMGVHVLAPDSSPRDLKVYAAVETVSSAIATAGVESSISSVF